MRRRCAGDGETKEGSTRSRRVGKDLGSTSTVVAWLFDDAAPTTVATSGTLPGG